MFLQSCRGKWKETSTSNFSKKNLPMDVFIWFSNGFKARTKVGKQERYKKLKQIRYFKVYQHCLVLMRNRMYFRGFCHFIIIAEWWCEIGCTSEGSVINQCWSKQFPVTIFSRMALLGSWATCYVSATCGKVGHV